MELRQIWKVLRRRWPLLIIPALVVLTYGAITYRPPGVGYNVGVRYMVGQPPAEAALTLDEEQYYNWLHSEYVANALADWVNGNGFRSSVSARLATRNIDVPAGAIGIVADNARSTLLVSVTYSDPDVLAEVMTAVTQTLIEQNADALPQINNPILISPLDEPIINSISAGIRSQLDLPVRVLAAFAVGFGLAFVVEYLDPAIRERDEIDALGLDVLGEIPKR